MNPINIPLEENQYIEFKSEAVKAADLADEIVAFANSEGGEIWLGIEEHGKISGLSRSYEEDVMNICRTACIPPIIPVYQSLVIDGKTIAQVSIPKGKDKPYYTSRHKYFIRVGSTKRVASREELLRLFQASGAIHYDVLEVDRAKLSDLDMSRISDYFSRYHVNFSEESEEGKKRMMAHTDIIGENSRPTMAGILIFGLSPDRLLPQSGISFAHFAGNEITEQLIDKKNIGGPLPRQADECLAALKANILTGSTIKGMRRIEAPHYPDKVFRELLVNACVHRNYSIHGSVIRVFLFADRLEVISPGPLPNSISIEKLSVGASFSRNPTLMRFMENLGYVDKLGRGLPMVCQEAAKLGVGVGFYETTHEFRVVLPLPDG
ncbi:Schlafen and ATP-dependent DNA helicase domains-containing protein [Desulfonema limicola]|uniref:Schlafen and ATP-dependent DNA helicase domains-containing protein n=1 Tax=Desulfonema limicola TaxID=45656 RepID=A0A975B5L2_9BACT|nr:RNA-binding domain-containing protein [Desulfonema limicola]QTA79231.1 Schlafen and ATP-dependent DNA helicase domains-containing protein [Desulfonema limicola]